jgi:hypothetical protein
MGDFVPFGASLWWWMFAALAVGRCADLFSTWVATPTLLLEANPVARWLGWRWAVPLNLGLAGAFAFFPLPAIIIATTSTLVASRNLQQAWLMRTMGEEAYRDWHVRRLVEARLGLFFGCLALQTLLVASIGIALAWVSEQGGRIALVPFGIGVGIVTYALTVAFYTSLAIRRIRRNPGLLESLADPFPDDPD